MYLCNLLESAGFAQQARNPVNEDKTACIEWGKNVIGGRERTRNNNTRKHFAHEVKQNGHMRLTRVPTALQLADVLTKSLDFPQWQAGILGKKVATT